MRTRTTLRNWLVLLAAFGGLVVLPVAAAEKSDSEKGDSDKESAFRFRFVGPRVGNRIAAVAGIAGDPSVYYAGAACGGVWKSVDGGNRWEPIFDKQSAAAIGALAVAPSQPGTRPSCSRTCRHSISRWSVRIWYPLRGRLEAEGALTV